MPAPFPSEDILPDDCPIDLDKFYVVDGEVIMPRYTVADLKRQTGGKEVRRCDFIARAKALSPESAETS